MIVKNEEKILEKSLESIKGVADEIIITDTESTDSTVEIAKAFTGKVHFFKWINDFSAARNFCSKFAKCEYILRWDADFILRDGDISKIITLKKKGFSGVDIVRFKWNIDYGDNGVPTKSIQDLFLYKRDKFHWESPIHNQLVANNPQETIKAAYFPTIEVNHHKDPLEKEFRYKQTAKILRDTLKKDPRNTRLLFLHAEGLLFDKNFEEALKYLRKYLTYTTRSDCEQVVIAISLIIFCYISLGKFSEALNFAKKYYKKYKHYPRLVLAYADALATRNIINSKKYYEIYLKNPITEDKSKYVYDFERFFIHPRLMLGKIRMLEKDFQAANMYLEEVIKKTNFSETKELAISISKSDE